MRSKNTAAAIAQRPLASVEPIDVTEHVGLVVWVIRKYRLGGYLDLTGAFGIDDLTQVGLLGVHRAAKDFDPSRGCTFGTYATPWIRAFVQRYIANQLGVLRVPVHVQEKARRDGRALPYGYGRSLDAPAHRGGDADSATLGDLLADDSPGPDAALDAESDRRQLAELLEGARLTERERRVLQLRVYQGQTLSAAGDALGVTRERVRQVEAVALAKLRKAAGVPQVRGSLTRVVSA